MLQKLCNLFRKKLQRKCFPVNMKFLRAVFFTEHLSWLLLNSSKETPAQFSGVMGLFKWLYLHYVKSVQIQS